MLHISLFQVCFGSVCQHLYIAPDYCFLWDDLPPQLNFLMASVIWNHKGQLPHPSFRDNTFILQFLPFGLPLFVDDSYFSLLAENG